MQLSHTRAAVSASFDDPNLVSAAGLVPVMRLADEAGLTALAQDRLSVPTDKGANAGAKITSLVAGMVAGADSINDMDLLRHGGMNRLFNRIYAPSTLGSFLRAFTFGHVRQLDAVASRFLTNLAGQSPNLVPAETSGYVFIDVDDTIVEVHGHQKQGAGFGYSGVRGINALLATVTTVDAVTTAWARGHAAAEPWLLAAALCGYTTTAISALLLVLAAYAGLSAVPALVLAVTGFVGTAALIIAGGVVGNSAARDTEQHSPDTADRQESGS